jgi:hypothetical protein
MQAAANALPEFAPGEPTDPLAKLSELAEEARLDFTPPHWLLEDISEPFAWEELHCFSPNVRPEITTNAPRRPWVHVRPNIPEWAAGRLYVSRPAMFWVPREYAGTAVELYEPEPELTSATEPPLNPWEADQLMLRDDEHWSPWPELPIYHLDLERLDHKDPDFLTLLEAELWLRSRQHWETGGYAVHLHATGDFYDFNYVRFWAEAIDRIPGVRAFGATRNLPDSADERARIIGIGLKRLTQAAPDYLAIRFLAADGSEVVERLELPPPTPV